MKRFIRRVFGAFVGAQLGAIVGYRFVTDEPLLPVTQRQLRKALRIALQYSGVSHCPVCGACRHDPNDQEKTKSEENVVSM